MILKFYYYEQGVITPFLLRQLKELKKEVQELEILVSELDVLGALEVESYKEELGTCEDLELTHYTYIFTTENDVPLACCNKPLDYVALMNISNKLMGKF